MTREHVHEVRKATDESIYRRALVAQRPRTGFAELDLFDPYYGDDAEFDECLETVRAASRCLTTEFHERLKTASSED